MKLCNEKRRSCLETSTPRPGPLPTSRGEGNEVPQRGLRRTSRGEGIEGPHPGLLPGSRGEGIEGLQDGSSPGMRRAGGLDAFTLIEVMIAITIFFMAMFAILGVLGSGVRAATLLRNNGPTAGMVIAQMAATNILTEGSDTGTFREIPIYEGYKWVSECRQVASNGLYQIDVVVVDRNGVQCSTVSALLFRPDSGNGQKMGLQQRR
jgi:hypothetical protein